MADDPRLDLLDGLLRNGRSVLLPAARETTISGEQTASASSVVPINAQTGLLAVVRLLALQSPCGPYH